MITYAVKSKKDVIFFTESNNKIYWDSGHYTLEGAKYLARIKRYRNWLKYQ